jgi:radical SAM superfamily enzyme
LAKTSCPHLVFALKATVITDFAQTLDVLANCSLAGLTFFSIKLMHSSSLARVATNESLVTESVDEFSLLPTRSSSVKYDNLLLILSATLTSFVCKLRTQN